jgi:WD40 repeat protein/tetratricopeptide (TPR) repeat protein
LTDHRFGGAIFSADSRLMFTYGLDSGVRAWDLIGNRPAGIAVRAGDRVALSPDGRFLLAEGDGGVRLWDLATSDSIGSPMRHRSVVVNASFSPDGRLALTASREGPAQLWEIGRVDLLPLPVPADDAHRTAGPVGSGPVGSSFYDGQFSGDGSRVLVGGELARVIETETGQPIGPPVPPRWPGGMQVVFSPDGRRVAATSHDGPYGNGGSTWSTCQVFDAATGRPVSPLLPHINWPSALAFSPDGKMLATGDYSGAVHRWDVETGARIGRPFAAGSIVVSLAFSPDGRLLAAGTAEPAYHEVLWDLDSGRRRGEPIAFRHWARKLVFSPDGAHLAVGSSDGTARLVETRTGRMTSHLPHEGSIASIAFTGDGRHVLTSGGAAARLWDVATGEPVPPPMEQPRANICAAALSSDGTRLAECYTDGSVGLWDIATSSPIGAGWRLRQRGRCVEFGRDGRSLSAVDGRGNVRTWRMPQPIDGLVESVVRYVQSRTDKRFESGRSIAHLDPKERRQLRDEFGAAPLAADETDEWGWHEASARDAETVGDGYGARWHLDRLIAARPGIGLLHARRARARLWEGDAASAGADIDRALALGPRDRILDWMAHRALDFHADGRSADAMRLLDRLIAERPDDWLAYSLRAEDLGALGRGSDREADLERAIARGADIPFLARIANERSRAGRWAEAVPLFDRAIAMGTVPYEVWMQAATAHLEIDDEAGFRRVCQAMRDRHRVIFELNVNLTLAGVATMAPGGVGDDGEVPGWIAPSLPLPASMRAPMKRWILQVVAAVLYRTGRYREAIARSEESIAVGGGEASPDDVLILAMAHFKAGDQAEARALLARPWRDEPDGPSAEDWWAAWGRRLQRREAVRLILDPSFPADVFER